MQVIRQSADGGILQVFAEVLEPELLGAAVLTPALCGTLLVEDQRGMCASRPHQLLLERAGSLTPR
jgi:hypothetical protein